MSIKLARKISFAIILLLCLGACAEDDDDDHSTDTPIDLGAQLSAKRLQVAVTEGGTSVFPVEVAAGVSSVQINAFLPGSSMQLQRITAPNGQLVFDVNLFAANRLNQAADPQTGQISIGLPVFPVEKTIARGNYTIEISSASGGEIDVTTISKTDAEPTRGVLPVNFIYAGSIATSDEIRDALDEVLKSTFYLTERAGISIQANYVDRVGLPNILPSPVVGSNIYLDTSAELPIGLNVYFAVDAEGLNFRENEFGIAGSVQGPFMPSDKSAIVISISKAAGPDGEFDSDDDDADREADSEIRILAETIAHEIFHYIGLFDTVTFSGNTVTNSDLLDSPKCPTLDACQETRAATSNILFPFALEIEDESPDFFERNRVSSQQAQVANLYVGVQ